MPTVNETIKALQEIVALNPKFGEFETIYATDDEGNEYAKCYSFPTITKIEDLSQNRFLELVRFFDDSKIQEDKDRDIALEDYNAVIIN